jgi:hypothetical protein
LAISYSKIVAYMREQGRRELRELREPRELREQEPSTNN